MNEESNGMYNTSSSINWQGDNLVYGVESLQHIMTTNANPPENKIREFSVKQLNYGYIVTVGCHQFAVEKAETVGKVITEYLANPNEVEKKWFANEFTLKKSK